MPGLVPGIHASRLPELHEALMQREGFERNAVVSRSVLASLGECVRAW
jgi:hypothetical protein